MLQLPLCLRQIALQPVKLLLPAVYQICLHGHMLHWSRWLTATQQHAAWSQQIGLNPLPQPNMGGRSQCTTKCMQLKDLSAKSVGPMLRWSRWLTATDQNVPQLA